MGEIVLEQFDRVKLISDKFKEEGLNPGMVGYILEIYPDGNLEVEFSDSSTGTTIALITLSPSDVTSV